MLLAARITPLILIGIFCDKKFRPFSQPTVMNLLLPRLSDFFDGIKMQVGENHDEKGRFANPGKSTGF